MTASQGNSSAVSGVVLTRHHRAILTDMLKGAAFLRFSTAKPLLGLWLIRPASRIGRRGEVGRWFDITERGREALANSDTPVPHPQIPGGDHE